MDFKPSWLFAGDHWMAALPNSSEMRCLLTPDEHLSNHSSLLEFKLLLFTTLNYISPLLTANVIRAITRVSQLRLTSTQALINLLSYLSAWQEGSVWIKYCRAVGNDGPSTVLLPVVVRNAGPSTDILLIEERFHRCASPCNFPVNISVTFYRVWHVSVSTPCVCTRVCVSTCVHVS